MSNMSIFNIKKGARRDRETVCGRHFARQMRPLLQQKKHNSIQSCFSLCISARLPSVKSFCQFDRRPNGISGGCAEPVRKTQVPPYKNLAVPLPWVVPPPVLSQFNPAVIPDVLAPITDSFSSCPPPSTSISRRGRYPRSAFVALH